MIEICAYCNRKVMFINDKCPSCKHEKRVDYKFILQENENESLSDGSIIRKYSDGRKWINIKYKNEEIIEIFFINYHDQGQVIVLDNQMNIQQYKIEKNEQRIHHQAILNVNTTKSDIEHKDIIKILKDENIKTKPSEIQNIINNILGKYNE